MSSSTTLTGKWFSNREPLRITVEEGTISSVETGVDLERSAHLAPGFFDIQVNGYTGIDYSSADLSREQIEELTQTLLTAGTTRHIPTIITNSQDRILRNLRVLAEAVEESPLLGAAIPGFHVEGPYISGEDGPRGAHDPRYVRDPDIEELKEWIEASRGLLRMVTLAPERPGATSFISAAVREGIIVSIGHTAANPEQIAAAVRAGATLSTHLGNGSHAQLPRLRNYLWEQLGSDNLGAGIIADGYHLPPTVMKVFSRVKGLDNLVLVSDVGPLGGCEVGVHKWGNIDVEVHPDGHLGLAGTEFLAGAGHLLDRGVAQFCKATGVTVDRAVLLCTENPARKLSLPGGREGPAAPQVGDTANLVQFDHVPGDESLRIVRTVLGKNTWKAT